MGSSSYIWKSTVNTASRARVEFLDICEAALTIEDVYLDGVWHLERIYSFIPGDLREDILSLVHISASGCDLGWSWEHTLYSAKQGYLWLIQNKLNWDRNINWLWLWKVQVPEKDCEVVRSVWVSLGFSNVSFFGSHEVHDWFKYDLLNEGCSKFAAIIWSIWQDRNLGIFQGVFGSSRSIAYTACSVNLGDDCAGFGWVIRNSSSQWVMGCLVNSFGSSVIRMELWSIWKGLAWAWEAGLKLVVCETDCVTAFELVTGWQVLLWHLEKEVIQLIFELKLRKDSDVRFELIPRNKLMLWHIS
ncbi:hypothetical protein AHAS_Ahas13G0233900 [Arachis hypogaea]